MSEREGESGWREREKIDGGRERGGEREREREREGGEGEREGGIERYFMLIGTHMHVPVPNNVCML
jgi:hypothetical protein